MTPGPLPEIEFTNTYDDHGGGDSHPAYLRWLHLIFLQCTDGGRTEEQEEEFKRLDIWVNEELFPRLKMERHQQENKQS